MLATTLLHMSKAQRTFTYFVRGSITLWLVSSLAGLDSTKQENMLLFLCRVKYLESRK